jgi:uncharacterized circularly permuted ATP-grasp superfamily protein
LSSDLGPAQYWGTLLRTPADASLCADLADRMRQQRLTFGGRLLCPFLRPFFLTSDDERRVVRAAEAIWTLGERVAAAALERPDLLGELGLSDVEMRLARIDPGYSVASTAGRADAFLLPDTLQFAEYNAESPAGPGYSQRLAEIFDGLPQMTRFRERFGARFYSPITTLLDALIASYRDWGGSARPPRVAIVDWREVPTWSEFELLSDAFTALGVPTVIADPRDLVFDGSRLVVGGAPIDLVYCRVLINDIVAKHDECRALVAAYERRAVCVANTLRCKIAHKKAFFAVLTDRRFHALFTEDERALIRTHVPWTRVVRDSRVTRDEKSLDLLEYLRAHRERFVIKPNDEYGGTGVALGWEHSASEWEDVIARAVSGDHGRWIAQERIATRREPFPVCEENQIQDRDMLVDFAPYLFRGRLSGFLTRLSATGLANVTSGGGQVPAFVVARRP